MKILIVGGKGTIGSKVSSHLAKKHEVIIAGRNSGDVTVDIADSGSIKSMYELSEKSMLSYVLLAKPNGPLSKP